MWQDEILLSGEAIYGELCQKMLNQQLLRRGITDDAVLSAMRKAPRHCFVSENQRNKAYADSALPTLNQQTISQPLIVGLMSQLLGVKRGQRVLEIGTGSGYQSMVLLLMGAEVVSVERDEALAVWAREHLSQFGFDSLEIRVGDGSDDMGYHACFDRIVVTAGATQTCPPALRKALKINGQMVIPMGDRKGQNLMTFIKRAETDNDVWIRGLACRFVPLIGAAGWSDPWSQHE